MAPVSRVTANCPSANVGEDLWEEVLPARRADSFPLAYSPEGYGRQLVASVMAGQVFFGSKMIKMFCSPTLVPPTLSRVVF